MPFWKRKTVAVRSAAKFPKAVFTWIMITAPEKCEDYCAAVATACSAWLKTGLKCSKRGLATFSEWAFLRKFERCQCGADPTGLRAAIHPPHLAGGANLIPFARKWHWHMAELLGGAAVLHGIGLWSMPSAFIVGGLAVIAAVEVRS